MTKAPIFASLVLVAACRMDARQQVAPPDVAGARAFVVEFYAWYHGRPDSTKNIDVLMTERRAWVEPVLAALIDSDNVCAARTHGTCKLDEDPILASQDPCEKYEVGGAMMHGDAMGVSVFAVCDGKRDTIPSVIARVVPNGSTWQFANFVYPADSTDLHAILSRKGE